LEDLPRVLGGHGWFVRDVPHGLGGPGRFLRDVPRGLGGPGRFLRDVPRGLGVPWAGKVRAPGRRMVLGVLSGCLRVEG
jgi:hypothetical protein